MASELTVQTLRGPTSGTNANKVLIPSGQTLHAPGHVIQVVSTSDITSVTNSSSTLARVTSLSATLTPVSTNSKVVMQIASHIGFQHTNTYGKCDIYRSISGGAATTNLSGETGGFGNIGNGASKFPVSLTYLDSPNTLAAVTYSLSFAFSAGGTGNVYMGANDGLSTITLMEIAG